MRGIVIAIALFLFALGLSIASVCVTVQVARLSLPIPALTCLLAIIIPGINYISVLATYRGSLAAQKRRYLTVLQREIVPLPSLLTLLWALSILDTILVTMTAGSLSPESLSCALSNRWGRLYSSKNAPRIRAIQDSFRCCGFNTLLDRAWPFQGGPDQVSARACVMRYGWKQACAGSWENYEKGVLGLMCAVGAAGLVYKIVVIILMNIHPEWFGGQYRSMRYEVDWGRPMIAEEADDPPEEPTPNPDRYLDHSMSAEERDERAELGIVPNPAWEAWIAIGRD